MNIDTPAPGDFINSRCVVIPVREAAARLGISPSLLYAMASRKRIPHYRIGGKILFDPADLETFKRSCYRAEAALKKISAVPPSGPFKALDPQRLAKAWRERGVL